MQTEQWGELAVLETREPVVEKDEFIDVNLSFPDNTRIKCLKKFSIILQIAASVLLAMGISTSLMQEGHYIYCTKLQ